jgi:peptide/nickel transport system substrate-binding protein
MNELLSGISRRSFMIGAGLVAVAGALVTGLPARAQDGKVLRIASGEADGPSGTLDPAFSTSDPDATRINLVYERLVVLDESFSPVPLLAESWETNEKGDVWTFHLRQGVTFHDGSAFTADDVVYTYKRLLDEATGSPATSQLTALKADGIEAVDPATVRFTLPSPIVDLPSLIANRFTYIVKAGTPSETLRTGGAGTGPFKVETFVPGQEPSTFVKNEAYWRPGLPKVDRVEVRSIPDDAARFAAIGAGQVDILWDLPRVGLESLEADPNIKIVTVPSPFVVTLSAWCDTPPFDDVRVRQAMKYVVDRQQVLDLVLGGRGTLGDDNPVAPWIQFALKEPVRGQDIERAKALLAGAGHPDGIDIQLYTSSVGPSFLDIANLYAEQAAQAGIRVEIVQAPSADYWDNVWLKQPFIVSSWSGRAADEALSAPYLSTSEWNETHWKRPDFDAFVLEAQRTVDVAKRGELYQSAQRLLRDEGGAIISIFPDALGATRANVSGWKLHPQQSTKDFSQVDLA